MVNKEDKDLMPILGIGASKAGMSLIEVVIAAAILSFLALSIGLTVRPQGEPRQGMIRLIRDLEATKDQAFFTRTEYAFGLSTQGWRRVRYDSGSWVEDPSTSGVWGEAVEVIAFIEGRRASLRDPRNDPLPDLMILSSRETSRFRLEFDGPFQGWIEMDSLGFISSEVYDGNL